MSFVVGSSVRAVSRTAPRAFRSFATNTAPGTDYFSRLNALTEHAARRCTIPVYILLLSPPTETSDLWRKIRYVVNTSDRDACD
jgi:cytochrome c oxidase subunit 6a